MCLPPDQQEQEKALPELIKFLTDRRAMLSKLSKQDQEAYYGAAPTAPGATARVRDGGRTPSSDAASPPAQATPLELSQIIDTTLLKAYLITNSALVGPLVRLENQCNIEESVSLLKSYKVRPTSPHARLVDEANMRAWPCFAGNQRYNELVEFYYGKSRHEDALQLLAQYVGPAKRVACCWTRERSRATCPPARLTPDPPVAVYPHPLVAAHPHPPRFGKAPDSPLSGVGPTVAYLRRLPAQYFSFVLKYSQWVLEKDAEEGLKIFISDDAASEEYPRGEVVAHLQKYAPSLRIQYLEYIIFHKDPKRQEKSTALHNMLVTYYVDAVMAEIRQANNGQLIEGPCSATTHEGEGWSKEHSCCGWGTARAPQGAHRDGGLVCRDRRQIRPSWASCLRSGSGSSSSCRRPSTTRPRRCSSTCPTRTVRHARPFRDGTADPDAVRAWGARETAAAMFEERALVLSRIHQHEQALTIYAHRLRDYNKAIECVSARGSGGRAIKRGMHGQHARSRGRETNCALAGTACATTTRNATRAARSSSCCSVCTSSPPATSPSKCSLPCASSPTTTARWTPPRSARFHEPTPRVQGPGLIGRGTARFRTDAGTGARPLAERLEGHGAVRLL